MRHAKMLSMCLQCVGDVSEKVEAFRKVLEPLRQTVKDNKFLGGDKISYSDIAVAGNFLVCILYNSKAGLA